MKRRLIDPVQYEISREKAGGLGRTETKLRAKLDALCTADRGGSRAPEASRLEALLWDAAEALTAFLVQREACGLRDTDYVLRFYGIPDDVVRRIGVPSPHRARWSRVAR